MTLDPKFRNSIQNLKSALTHRKKAEKDVFYFAGLSKSFEVCLEYAWKYLKREIESEGLEVLSPKEAIKKAGKVLRCDGAMNFNSFAFANGFISQG